jgi:hypothetical protein
MSIPVQILTGEIGMIRVNRLPAELPGCLLEILLTNNVIALENLNCSCAR